MIKPAIVDWASRTVSQLAGDPSVLQREHLKAQNVSVETRGNAHVVQATLEFDHVPAITDSNISATLNANAPALISRLNEIDGSIECEVHVSDTGECFEGYDSCGLCVEAASSSFPCERFSNLLNEDGRKVPECRRMLHFCAASSVLICFQCLFPT